MPAGVPHRRSGRRPGAGLARPAPVRRDVLLRHRPAVHRGGPRPRARCPTATASSTAPTPTRRSGTWSTRCSRASSSTPTPASPTRWTWLAQRVPAAHRAPGGRLLRLHRALARGRWPGWSWSGRCAVPAGCGRGTRRWSRCRRWSSCSCSPTSTRSPSPARRRAAGARRAAGRCWPGSCSASAARSSCTRCSCCCRCCCVALRRRTCARRPAHDRRRPSLSVACWSTCRSRCSTTPGWWEFFRLNQSRAADPDSLYYVVSGFTGWPGFDGPLGAGRSTPPC